MSNYYHIIWIDDEWDLMTSFKTNCLLRYNIELTPFKTQKDGLDAYAQNPQYWEAIILDAKVLDESLNERPDIKSLNKAITRINKEFDVPFFISTGQPDYISDVLFESLFSGYYKKGTDDEKLCLDILKSVEEKAQRQIMNRYQEIFSWLPREMYGEVISLLTIIEKGDSRNTNVFNNIRKILDWIMTELNRYGILALDFNGSNLNDCSRFLSSNELQEFVPQYMQRQIHSCCTISNEGSHRLVADEDVRTGTAPFLVRSTVFELLNILMWMHQLPKDDATCRKITNIAFNLLSKTKKDELSLEEELFEPQYDEEFHVWHCGDTMIGLRTWEGGKIIVLDRQENTSNNPKIKEKYPYFAKFKKK